MKDHILTAAKAAFEEAAKPEYGLWFHSLDWDELDQLHPVFIACARAAIEAFERAQSQTGE